MLEPIKGHKIAMKIILKKKIESPVQGFRKGKKKNIESALQGGQEEKKEKLERGPPRKKENV